MQTMSAYLTAFAICKGKEALDFHVGAAPTGVGGQNVIRHVVCVHVV